MKTHCWKARILFRRRKPCFAVAFCGAALALLVFCVGIASELRPLVETVAASHCTNLISLVISAAVDDCLSEQSAEYSDFISVDRSESGEILSLSGRPAECGRFKRSVIERITGDIGEMASRNLNIPVGNLSGSVFLSGLGPDIKVKVHSVGEVSASYGDDFISAGVNQTKHSVYLNVAVTVYLLIPGRILPVMVTDQICVAETIILGRVPDTYVHLEKGSESYG